MIRNSTKNVKRPESKFITTIKIFLLILWVILFNITIELTDYSFIIKEDEEIVIDHINSEYEYNDNGDVIIGLFYLFIILLYLISLICVPIILFVVKRNKTRLILVAMNLLPILCCILIYNINSSIYDTWPNSSEEREALFRRSSKLAHDSYKEVDRESVWLAINSWSYCEARHKYVERTNNECKKVLMIIKSYRDRENKRVKMIVY
ncbi:MAG: hypothetical protein H7833_12250 [Magnetococcus sp. DMHC-1]